eukprot:g2723.t1
MSHANVVNVEKSASDTREYRYLKLKNELSVLLVSDSATDKAGAAMSVGVGYYCDPDNIPGVAHFCEHMLFLGTTKYPDENSYSAFLNENGGYSNAYTTHESTNYYFQLTHPHLEQALDRFAQFFISPLFTETATGRELEAVNSEHEKNLQNDSWRVHQLWHTTSNPLHPCSKFGTGSKATLDLPQTRDVLLNFHQTYYSSNIMNLCVYGNESLDLLQQWVESKFSVILNKSVAVPKYVNIPAQTSQQLGSQLFVVPIKDLRSVSIVWNFPPLKDKYTKKASGYISHLLGDEGPGSILAALKNKGWANELMAGLVASTNSYAQMQVKIDLTKDGMEHVFNVVDMVYQYIHMMRLAKPQEWIWQEMKDINEMNFRFKQKSEVDNYVSSIAASMESVKPEHILSHRYLVEDYDPKFIGELMSLLNPKNCRVTFTGLQYEDICDKQEKWYGTKYKEENISEENLLKWSTLPSSADSIDPLLHLPPKNVFVASDFTLRREAEARKSGGDNDNSSIWREVTESVSADPQNRGLPPPAVNLIRQDDKAEIWFKQDDFFKQPKVNFIISLHTPLAYATCKSCVLTDLTCALVKDALNEYAYSAEVAGLSYQVYNTVEGLQLCFFGYNDKMYLLAGKVAETLANLKIDEKRFEMIRDKVRLDKKNFEMEQPYNWSLYNTTHALRTPRWHNVDKVKMLDAIQVDELKDFIKMLLKRLFIQALVHGNVTEEEALALVNAFEAPLNADTLMPAERFLLQRIVKLPSDGSSFIYTEPVRDPDNINSAIEVYFQIGRRTHETNARLSLLASIMSEPCFDHLRTKEQLGYIVFSGTVTDDGILGLRIIVQSAKCVPKRLDEHIEAFLVSFRAQLGKITDDEFKKQRDSLIISYLKKPKSMLDETFKYVSELESKTYVFDRKWKVARELDCLSLHDIVSFFDYYISKGAAERKKLSVRIVGRVVEEGTGKDDDNEKKNGGSNAEKAGKTNGTDATEKKKSDTDGTASTTGDLMATDTSDVIVEETTLSYGIVTNDGEIIIKDLDQFKRSMCLYPVEASYSVENANAKNLLPN